MNQPMRIALPVPAAGTALGGSGEAYVASLVVKVEDDNGVTTNTGGDTLEMLLIAMRIRHLAFDPRSFAFRTLSMDAAKFVKLVDANWSSIDASGQEVIDLADAAVSIAKGANTITFTQVN